MSLEINILYVPCPNKKNAKAIGLELLRQKAVACIQIFKATSFFNWHGKTEHVDEVILIAKTMGKSVAKANKIIENLHKYETPCILEIPSKVNKEYYQWMKETMH
jgi:periplasmic divalent cation tolerance protein